MSGIERQDDPCVAYADGLSRRLVAAAFALIARRYVVSRHQIGAALLDNRDRIHLGLHIEAMVGRASICAEAVALGEARLAGDSPLVAVAAVRYPKPYESCPARIVPPCGLCRELLLDYAPNLAAVVVVDGEARCIPLAELLPHKYIGTKWG